MSQEPAPRRRPGLRRRLIWSLIGLVAATVAVVGLVSVVVVDRTLRNRLAADAVAATEFNLVTLAPAAGLGDEATTGEIQASGILDRYLARGLDGVWVEAREGSRVSAGAGQVDVSAGLREIVDGGEIAYEFTDSPRGPVLVTAGRLPPSGPAFFFVTSTGTITDAIRQIVWVIAAAGLAAIAVGSGVAATLANRTLTPVGEARQAAERMASGDLEVRLAVEASDEFGALSASFNRMASSLAGTIRQLDLARERERRFVADVSHELRTPLTGLVNEARLLAEKLAGATSVTDEHRSIARLLDDDVDRLRRLVEELLEISRLDSEGVETRLSPVDLEAFLTSLVRQRHAAADTVIDVSGPVVTDPRALERIVGNLLDNARIHAPDTETSVSASVSEGDLVIEVADRGPGVEADRLDSIFDRFSTGDPARGSSGLGLAIAAQYATRLGGNLSAALRPGGGLAITARIPVGKLLHDREAAATPSPQSEL